MERMDSKRDLTDFHEELSRLLRRHTQCCEEPNTPEEVIDATADCGVGKAVELKYLHYELYNIMPDYLGIYRLVCTQTGNRMG